MVAGDAARAPYCEPPVVPGHEFIGEVVALGDGARERHGLELGDRAIAEQLVPCGCCRYCHTGNYHMCVPHDIYGFHRRTPGAMAQFMRYLPDSIVHRVPKSLAPHEAAFIEPLACAIHCVERGDIQFHHTVGAPRPASVGVGIGRVGADPFAPPPSPPARRVCTWRPRCGRSGVRMRPARSRHGCRSAPQEPGSPDCARSVRVEARRGAQVRCRRGP